MENEKSNLNGASVVSSSEVCKSALLVGCVMTVKLTNILMGIYRMAR